MLLSVLKQTKVSFYTYTLFVVKKSKLIKYTTSISSELLIKDEYGESRWIDGRLANVLGVDIYDADSSRTTKEYRIVEYDLEKSQKRKYKVILDETVDMNENDICEVKRIINDEKNND